MDAPRSLCTPAHNATVTACVYDTALLPTFQAIAFSGRRPVWQLTRWWVNFNLPPAVILRRRSPLLREGLPMVIYTFQMIAAPNHSPDLPMPFHSDLSKHCIEGRGMQRSFVCFRPAARDERLRSDDSPLVGQIMSWSLLQTDPLPLGPLN
jgi:hypothetical protein